MAGVVKPSAKEFTQVGAFLSASGDVRSWISGARALAVMCAALDSGVLDALRSPRTEEQIADVGTLNSSAVGDLCLALEALGVAERRGATWHLAPDYVHMAERDAVIPLSSLIRHGRFTVRTLEGIGSAPEAYTALDPDDVVAIAEASGISALSAAPHVATESTRQIMPEVDARWTSGARHLEAGCGVGNALFGIALTYPNVTAVGIEIDELTAAEAQRRAVGLKVDDRVEVRCSDVCDLDDEASFDTIQWSQFFFPAESRGPALGAIRGALKPGGYLLMPYFDASADRGDHRDQMLRLAWRSLRARSPASLGFLNDVVGARPRQRRAERRTLAEQALLFRHWGIPILSVAELVAEAEDAGFDVIRSSQTAQSPLYATRGLLLAQRSD